MIETVAAFCLDQRVWLLRHRELVSMGMVFVQSFIRKKDDGFQRLYSLLNTWNVVNENGTFSEWQTEPLRGAILAQVTPAVAQCISFCFAAL